MVKRVQREQLFRGFSSADNNREIIYDINLIRIDLLNHFNTRIGERVMYPNFGCIIWDLLFEPFTEIVKEEIVNNVREIIEFDSRVELTNLIVDTFEHGIIVQVEALYRPFQVVDSFSVEFDRRAVERANGNDFENEVLI